MNEEVPKKLLRDSEPISHGTRIIANEGNGTPLTANADNGRLISPKPKELVDTIPLPAVLPHRGSGHSLIKEALRKSFGFGLTGQNGHAAMYYGQLHTSVTILNFERFSVEGKMVNSLKGQDPIPVLSTHQPSNLDSSDGYLFPTELGWAGNVYLYWEVDPNTGEVSTCDVRGPDEPPGVPITELDIELNRDISGPDGGIGKYWAQIGSVSSMGVVEQLISGDVTWAVTLIPAAETTGGFMTHPWKVTNIGAGSWGVETDSVYGQGGPITPGASTVAISSGFIYLEISRDSGSREMTAVTLMTGASVPTSSQDYQYRVIAEIIDDTNWIQIQYEEIRIEELMIVANGQFTLAPMEMSSRNTYDPPT